ncbi:MAG TPA: glycine zipper 2TM domain-containing protein [Xanthomonadaceae bacterium]|nr:glycine zipper 2TM domain-containing protein [Xanthomonadaceae bacterium]
MNRLSSSVLVLALAVAGPASAQSSVYERYDDRYDDGRYDGRYDDRYQGARYDYARVISVRPVVDGYRSHQTSSSRCYQRSDSYAGGNSSYGGDRYRDGDYRDDAYRDDGYRDDGYDDRYRGTSTGRTVATVLGGIVGAAVGSQVGGGSARYATAAIGSMVGGIAGQKVYENSVRDRYPRGGTVTVCDPVPDDRYYDRYGTSGGGVNAYDVTYEYAGREYTARTNYHPGDRIRVRVDVRPE